MRRFRSLVLCVLLALAALVGGLPAAPPAAAALDGIEWRNLVPLISPSGVLVVCATGTGSFEPGQQVRLDVMLGGTWVEKASRGPTTYPVGCLYFSPMEVLPGPGRYFFRARAENTDGQTVSADIALTVEQDQGIYGINGPTLPTLYVYTTTPDKAVTATVVSYGQSVDLQRRSGRYWVHVGRVTMPDTGERRLIRFRLPTKGGSVTYRLVNRAATWTPLHITLPFLVHQTDYEEHEDYLIRARRLVAAYCPRTPIHIDTADLAHERVRNTFNWTVHDDVNRRTGLASRIDLRSGLSAAALREHAVHSCAEAVQDRPLIEGRWQAEWDKAAYLFRRNADYEQARCMTFAATGWSWDGRTASRTTSCTATQLDNARRMWSQYGTKYQPVPYWYEEW